MFDITSTLESAELINHEYASEGIGRVISGFIKNIFKKIIQFVKNIKNMLFRNKNKIDTQEYKLKIFNREGSKLHKLNSYIHKVSILSKLIVNNKISYSEPIPDDYKDKLEEITNIESDYSEEDYPKSL